MSHKTGNREDILITFAKCDNYLLCSKLTYIFFSNKCFLPFVVQIDWLAFLQRIFNEHDYKVTNDTIVVVYALDYLKNISALIKKTDQT